MPDNDMVTITRAEYDRLIEAEMKLDALLGAVIEADRVQAQQITRKIRIQQHIIDTAMREIKRAETKIAEMQAARFMRNKGN